jgi:hypothetical protein
MNKINTINIFNVLVHPPNIALNLQKKKIKTIDIYTKTSETEIPHTSDSWSTHSIHSFKKNERRAANTAK